MSKEENNAEFLLQVFTIQDLANTIHAYLEKEIMYCDLWDSEFQVTKEDWKKQQEWHFTKAGFVVRNIKLSSSYSQVMLELIK